LLFLAQVPFTSAKRIKDEAGNALWLVYMWIANQEV